MITREQAVQWLRNHPEETGDGAYMAQTIVDLHDDLAAAQDRADVMTEALRLAAERDLSGKLETELRRLRAAEAPGTDDEAFGGTGWEWLDGEWQRPEGPPVWKHNGVWFTRVAGKVVRFTVAIDAMRAAVPGSV